MLHQKADGITASAAAKALKDFLGWRYSEGRRFFIVKRTKSEVVGSPLFEFHKATYDFRDVNSAEDLLYGLRRDQKSWFERRI